MNIAMKLCYYDHAPYDVPHRAAARRKTELSGNREWRKHRSGGQQTLESMRTINAVTSLPVIRPVAAMDKVEIIDLAEKSIHMKQAFSRGKTAARSLHQKIR